MMMGNGLIIIIGLSVVLNLALASALLIVMLRRNERNNEDDSQIPLTPEAVAAAAEEIINDVQSVQSLSLETEETPQAAPERKHYTVQEFIPEREGVLTNLTVLIADDDPVNIEVLVGMLQHMGMNMLVTVQNGVEAVESAEQHIFDIIYMDIQMPEKNGLEAAKEIKAEGKNTHAPIIPITGFSRIVNEELCKEAGMTGFLQKPVDYNDLLAATQKALLHKKLKAV